MKGRIFVASSSANEKKNENLSKEIQHQRDMGVIAAWLDEKKRNRRVKCTEEEAHKLHPKKLSISPVHCLHASIDVIGRVTGYSMALPTGRSRQSTMQAA